MVKNPINYVKNVSTMCSFASHLSVTANPVHVVEDLLCM